LHHSLLTVDSAELIDLIGVVFIWYEAVLEGLAVFAYVNWGAFDTVVVTSGLIDRACLISDLILMHELEGGDGFTTMATIIIGGA